MSRRLNRSSIAWLVTGILACVALADLPARQRPPTFKSGVEVVLIDVSVVDRTGRPVDDLAATDFTVTVDGKPRTVASAQFLRYESQTKTQTAKRTVEVPPRPAAPPSPPPPRLVIVAIDEDSLETGEGLIVKQAAEKFLYTLFLERTPYGDVKGRPSPTAFEDANLEREGIENVTSATGGTLMLAIGTLDQYFERVVTELSGSYLLGTEVAAADRDGRTHQVDVKANRRNVEVRARRRYVIEQPRAVRTTPAAARNAARKPKADEPAPITVEAMTAEEEAQVGRASAYATAYEAELSGLVAEERYIQRTFKNQKLTVTSVRPSGGGRSNATTQEENEWVPEEVRQLKSDFLLVKAPGGGRWLPFRDVVEVDGKKVREREERLQQLFVTAPATAAGRAAEITAESARYNIGFVERNVNLPTLALRFLDPACRSRLVFRKQGQATVSGVRTVEFAFAEHGSPTVVRDGATNIPATGSFWIDPADGRVVRTTIRLKPAGVSIELTVTYQPDARAGTTWVPASMREVYQSAARRLECEATYSKIRRFQVTTDEVQKEN